MDLSFSRSESIGYQQSTCKHERPTSLKVRRDSTILFKFAVDGSALLLERRELPSEISHRIFCIFPLLRFLARSKREKSSCIGSLTDKGRTCKQLNLANLALIRLSLYLRALLRKPLRFDYKRSPLLCLLRYGQVLEFSEVLEKTARLVFIGF